MSKSKNLNAILDDLSDGENFSSSGGYDSSGSDLPSNDPPPPISISQTTEIKILPSPTSSVSFNHPSPFSGHTSLTPTSSSLGQESFQQYQGIFLDGSSPRASSTTRPPSCSFQDRPPTPTNNLDQTLKSLNELNSLNKCPSLNPEPTLKSPCPRPPTPPSTTSSESPCQNSALKKAQSAATFELRPEKVEYHIDPSLVPPSMMSFETSKIKSFSSDFDKTSRDSFTPLMSPSANKYQTLQGKNSPGSRNSLDYHELQNLKVRPEDDEINISKTLTFPPSKENLCGFCCSKKTAAYIFFSNENEKKNLSIFYSKGIGNVFIPGEFPRDSNIPKSRRYFSMFPLSENQVAILGGDNCQSGSDIWVFTNAGLPRWDQLSNLGPVLPQMKHHKSVSIYDDGQFLVYSFGGILGNNYMKDIVLAVLNVTGGIFISRIFKPNGSLPNPRTEHSFTLCKKYVYLFGGLADDETTILGDFWALDLSVNSKLNPVWTNSRFNSGPCARYGHQAYSKDGNLYISGGYGVNGKLNDTWSFDGLDWYLISSFDIEEDVYASPFGLIKYGPRFLLVDEKVPVFALNTKLKRLCSRRDTFVTQSLSTNSEMRDLQISFLNITNDAFEKYRTIYLEEKEVPSFTKQIQTELSEKLELLTTKTSDKKVEKETEQTLYTEELKKLKKKFSKHVEVTQLDPANFQSFENLYQKFDTPHINLLTSYYHIMQLRKYEENLGVIKHHQHKISRLRCKYEQRNSVISELLANIPKINTMTAIAEQQAAFYGQKVEEENFEQAAERVERLESQRAQLRYEFNNEIKEIVERAEQIEQLFSINNSIKQFFKKSSKEDAKKVQEMLVQNKEKLQNLCSIITARKSAE